MPGTPRRSNFRLQPAGAYVPMLDLVEGEMARRRAEGDWLASRGLLTPSNPAAATGRGVPRQLSPLSVEAGRCPSTSGCSGLRWRRVFEPPAPYVGDLHPLPEDSRGIRLQGRVTGQAEHDGRVRHGYALLSWGVASMRHVESGRRDATLYRRGQPRRVPRSSAYATSAVVSRSPEWHTRGLAGAQGRGAVGRGRRSPDGWRSSAPGPPR
jgi:hypothetical protein